MEGKILMHQHYQTGTVSDDRPMTPTAHLRFGLDVPGRLGMPRVARPSHDNTKPDGASICSGLQSPTELERFHFQDDSREKRIGSGGNIPEAQRENRLKSKPIIYCPQLWSTGMILNTGGLQRFVNPRLMFKSGQSRNCQKWLIV